MSRLGALADDSLSIMGKDTVCLNRVSSKIMYNNLKHQKNNRENFSIINKNNTNNSGNLIHWNDVHPNLSASHDDET